MDSLPEIVTLKQMLERLEGLCRRTFLLNHLKENPFFDGAPTHHRIGNKIIFYPEDIKALMASFVPGKNGASGKRKGHDSDYDASPSSKAYARARKQLAISRANAKRRK
jgi:hypothetical protein